MIQSVGQLKTGSEAGMMISPQRETSGQKADLGALEGGCLGSTQSSQGRQCTYKGAKISPTQVAKFVDHKSVQLRSGVFLLA